MLFNSGFFKAALIIKKLKQREISLAARIPETELSAIVNGRLPLTEKRIKKIASIAKILKFPLEKFIVLNSGASDSPDTSSIVSPGRIQLPAMAGSGSKKRKR